ncbi:DUF1653 domain-containing protein [Bacteriovorax stolpii]|uniref:DUF1653 domain-containing protein n=2 Tax=Bacteriovorax stolpii TaxID=960 RepID=A0A2K9NPH0_BACTC|nr:DUF1653 domain-containing protein [Bacteriovorax stolpii]QDK42632.1 DUF1653 domain-containing protein [Bacteriovorax stolpii]
MTMKLGLYKHYKGKHYQVLGICKHSETLEDLVLYETLYENEQSRLWVRPVAMFLERIVVDGKELPRFEYIGDRKSNQRM